MNVRGVTKAFEAFSGKKEMVFLKNIKKRSSCLQQLKAKIIVLSAP